MLYLNVSLNIMSEPQDFSFFKFFIAFLISPNMISLKLSSSNTLNVFENA